MTEQKANILVVDDAPENLRLLAGMLARQGYKARRAPSGRLALQAVESTPPDLILLDVDMPEMNGYEVCERLKGDDRFRDIPVIFISALGETEDKLRAFSAGGIDYVRKPFQFEEVEARITTHLKIRSLQRELERHNRELAARVAEQVEEIVEAQLAAVFGLARLAEARDEDTGAHLFRVRWYSRALATRLAERNLLPGQIDPKFVEIIDWAAPLHDIGKVCIPDAVLLKRGPLNAEEWAVMRRHTTVGAETMEAVLKRHPRNAFLRMGAEIARSHHENWDGSGYPDGLAGDSIPLAARVFSIADRYDALRSTRPYKLPFSHDEAVRILVGGNNRTRPEHFDPRVLRAFGDVAVDFARIWDRFADDLSPLSPPP